MSNPTMKITASAASGALQLISHTLYPTECFDIDYSADLIVRIGELEDDDEDETRRRPDEPRMTEQVGSVDLEARGVEEVDNLVHALVGLAEQPGANPAVREWRREAAEERKKWAAAEDPQ
jgi:hypothetical protein